VKNFQGRKRAEKFIEEFSRKETRGEIQKEGKARKKLAGQLAENSL
jgi:hypothetical protein